MSGDPLQGALEVLGRRLDPASATPVAAAFSGGGDSLALLLAARAFARACGRRLIALHVDHGLQPQSRAWAAQARRTAERLGADFVELCWTGAKPAAGLPAAARAARHRLIAEAARTAGAQVVLIGHTLDDQLENALMRGAGAPVGPLAEWSPSPVWPEGRGLFLCRPLLARRRAELRDWLGAQGLAWIDDPANDDLRHARARARRAVGEGAADRVAEIPDLTRLAGCCRATPWGGLEIDRRALAVAPASEALRLLQLAAACASGAEALARPARAEGLRRRLCGGDALVATLGGARFEAGPQLVTVCREAGEAERGGLRPLALQPGRAAVWDGRFELLADRPGRRVQALRGLAARLPPEDRVLLRRFPPAVRPSLPVLSDVNDARRAPRLAFNGPDAHIDRDGVRAAALTEGRFLAAAGVVRREVELGTNARMADVPPPPYVEAEGKD